MFESILVPFGVIFAAEFLDKSQLSVLLLSSRTKKYTHLLTGTILAFLIVDGIAIFFGAYLTKLIPQFWLTLVAAGLFIYFGIRALLEKPTGAKETNHNGNILLASFSLIFFSEWGDKTQLASALFATQYPPIPVLIGVMGALTLISLFAIFVGAAVFSRFDRTLVSRVSGVIFILLGISFFILR